MSITHDKSQHTGYHWRDELVTALLPYVNNDEQTRIELRRIARQYVPGFFPIDIPAGEGTWLSSENLSSVISLAWWRTEIEEIGTEIGRLSTLNDSQVKEVFREHRWETDVPVNGIGLEDSRNSWKYDAYKNGIGVEVELSSRSQVFKDAFKFLVGEALSQIEIGIVIVRRDREYKVPYLGTARRDSHAIFYSLPMLKLAFYGFPRNLVSNSEAKS